MTRASTAVHGVQALVVVVGAALGGGHKPEIATGVGNSATLSTRISLRRMDAAPAIVVHVARQGDPHLIRRVDGGVGDHARPDGDDAGEGLCPCHRVHLTRLSCRRRLGHDVGSNNE